MREGIVPIKFEIVSVESEIVSVESGSVSVKSKMFRSSGELNNK
jgi:hypothetical protein